MLSKIILSVFAITWLFLNAVPAQQLTLDAPNKLIPEKSASIKSDEDKIVAKLINILKTKDINAQIVAAEALGSYGTDAVEAMELLAERADSKNKQLSAAAISSLKRIAKRNNNTFVVKESNFGNKENTAETKSVTPLSGQVMDSNREKVSNAEVQLVQGDKVLETQFADDNGNFRFNTQVSESEESQNSKNKVLDAVPKAAKDMVADSNGQDKPKPIVVRTNKEGFYQTEQPVKAAAEVYLKPLKGRVGGETWRAVVGYEQAGASSQNSSRDIFFDFGISVPLTSRNKYNGDWTSFGARMRTWGDIRLSSVPDPSLDEKSLKDFVIGFNETVGNTKVGKVVQALETTAGIEIRGFSTPKTFDGIFSKTRHRFSVNFIAGGGIITPLSPSDSNNKAIFTATDEARRRYGLSADKTFIAFVSPDRDRFYREYFAGIRLKTLYFDEYDRPLDIHPANLDITFGQNEAVTGGRLRGGILRFDGFYPLPIGKLNFLYLYGTAQMKPSRHKEFDTPLFLDAAPAGTSFNGNNTAIIPIPTINRDYYKIGIGVNPFKIFCSWLSCGDSTK